MYRLLMGVAVKCKTERWEAMNPGAPLLWGVWGRGVSHPPKIFKNRENSGKLRGNSVTSGNICGC